MKHTPGPWEIKACPCGKCGRYYTDNGFFYEGSGYTLADIKLIAAAPELLWTLKTIAPYLKDQKARRNKKSWADQRAGSDAGELLSVVEKAIARAEGKS